LLSRHIRKLKELVKQILIGKYIHMGWRH
jgi:hypothetical protein